jgi:error-prone DNA polymerase
MGFYQPAQIVSDAKNHRVEIREVDINYSDWDNLLEPTEGRYFALRLGFRQVKGLKEDEMRSFVAGRQKTIRSIGEVRDSGLSTATIERLADADAFRSLELDRRQALWEVSTKDHSVGVFKGEPPPASLNEKIELPKMEMSEHVVHDYASIALSLKGHPVSFVREKLKQVHIVKTSELQLLKNGDTVKVAGLVLVRQRPGTAKGVCFMTIEDESGFANLVIWEKMFDKYRKEILQSKLIMVEGKLQIEGDVIHVIVHACYNFSPLLRKLIPTEKKDIPVLTLSRADEKAPLPIHGGRNFK